MFMDDINLLGEDIANQMHMLMPIADDPTLLISQCLPL